VFEQAPSRGAADALIAASSDGQPDRSGEGDGGPGLQWADEVQSQFEQDGLE
jgi:hypothetical protein